MIKFDGIGYTIPGTNLAVGRATDAPIARQILRNFSSKRSGDIYIIYEPHWYATADGDVALVNHGSPWRNDTFLPIVLRGAMSAPHVFADGWKRSTSELPWDLFED